MKYSIRRQFSFVFIGIMAGTILVCWFVNSTFLDRYYINNKKNVLLNAYHTIELAIDDGIIMSDEFDIELQKICGKYNISMAIFDSDFQPIKLSVNEPSLMARRLWDNIIGLGGTSEDSVLDDTDHYTIQIIKDERTQTDYIEMWGFYSAGDNGNVFLLRSPLDGIRDSIAITNRFLAYVGIAAVLVSAFIIWLVSRKVTEPIMELARISQRMIHLDFEAKYHGRSKTEIALLGSNINELSETLQATISELKTANNELRKDIERKNKVDEMRKEFLSNVSHELKTPIALIQGYAEGLKEEINDDAESREFYCAVIMDEASKMNNMVKKLMTLNEIEFGNDVVSMERFDVAALAANYIQSADILTRQKEITVRFDQREPVYVWADEFKTEEVFANYYSNAINHAAGERIIEVTMLRQKSSVRIAVFNTGVPIPEESISHIWEKFYKVDKARTREYGGSGVGLSIVKAIMESMNQRYGVNNYENGVEFWFELETKA